jgi:DNA-binding NtrC family response regulator
MNQNIEQKILLIEDNPGDRRLIQELLNEITSFKYHLITTETLKEGCEHIVKNEFILILLDLNLPDSTGKNTFDTIIKYADQTPVVLVSGLQNLELSLSLIKEGAQDYIAKNDLNSSLLARTIEFAIERKKLLSQLKAKTRELEQLNSFFVNRELKIIELNQQIKKLLEKAEEEKNNYN